MTKRRSVSFHQIELRHHDVIVGDNPSATGGPPIQIDWYPKRIETRGVDEYEDNRGPRRRGDDLRIPGRFRGDRLREAGFSEEEIGGAEREAIRDEERRSETNRALRRQPADEAIEKAKRKFKRIRSLTSKKKEQERLWKNARRFSLEMQSSERRGSVTGASNRSPTSGEAEEGEQTAPRRVKKALIEVECAPYESATGVECILQFTPGRPDVSCDR